MTITPGTVVSENSGAPNIIDYSIGLVLLLQFVERLAVAEEAIAEKQIVLSEEAIKQTAALKVLAEEATKQTGYLAVLAEHAPPQTAAQQAIAAEQAAQTPLIERIAVSNDGIWECCRFGRVDAEAFVEITMRYHNETPEQRWARYEAFLMRDAGIPNGSV